MRRSVIIGVLLLGLIVVGGEVFLPRGEVVVVRTAVVRAPAAPVYGLVATPREWPGGAPWLPTGALVRVDFRGPPLGTGASAVWASAREGTDTLTILDAMPMTSIRYELTSGGSEPEYRGRFVFAGSRTSTTVQWTLTARADQRRLGGWRALWYRVSLPRTIDDALARLARLGELASAPEPTPPATTDGASPRALEAPGGPGAPLGAAPEPAPRSKP